MSTHRHRALSPPRHRDAHRASTGNVYSTSFDTLSSGHSSGRTTVNSVVSHTSTTPYEIQPIRKTILADGKKTQYIVRPRHNSVSGQETRKPLSIALPRNLSPSRRGTLVSPREVVSAGLPRDDASRYLQTVASLPHRQQASRHHQRHHSTSRAELVRYDPHQDRNERLYSVRMPEAGKQYYVARPQASRQIGEDEWSYTGPREQFGIDYPEGPPRDSYSRRERSLSAYESDREISSRRGHGPPPTSASRQLGRIEYGEFGRHAPRASLDSDSDRPNEKSRRHNSLKPPTILHQQSNRDEGYSSARDDYESRNQVHLKDRSDEHRRIHRPPHRNGHQDSESKEYRREYGYDDGEHDRGNSSGYRRKPRSRDPSPDRSHFKDLAASAIGSLAAAGTLGTFLGRDGKDKSGESESDETKHRRRHRHRHPDSNGGSDDPDERRRSHRRDEASHDKLEPEHERRRRPSRQHYDDGDNGDTGARPHRSSRPRGSSHVRSGTDDVDRSTRDAVPPHAQAGESDSITNRTISPGENEDDRPRKVMLVEPEKKEELKPRGILKPARQVPFPEDPNPIREGVAPLKDATKNGVPPNARWTKINRVLVNPEALQRANERFEERDEYVIVLRVVSRDEIQKLAEKTVQIREARRHKERESNEKRRNAGNDDADFFSDDEYNTKQRLAIEAPPPGPTNDLRNLAIPSQSAQSQPQAAPIRSTSSETNVSQSYSQNV